MAIEEFVNNCQEKCKIEYKDKNAEEIKCDDSTSSPALLNVFISPSSIFNTNMIWKKMLWLNPWCTFLPDFKDMICLQKLNLVFLFTVNLLWIHLFNWNFTSVLSSAWNCTFVLCSVCALWMRTMTCLVFAVSVSIQNVHKKTKENHKTTKINKTPGQLLTIFGSDKEPKKC